MVKYTTKERLLEILSTLNDRIELDIEFRVGYKDNGETIFVAKLGYVTYVLRNPTLEFLKEVVDFFGAYEIFFVNIDLV